MDMEKTGRFLAGLRKGRGWTQQEAADALGVSDKTISKWECGYGFPDVSMLTTIADLYGVTADELLRGEAKEAAIPVNNEADEKPLYQMSDYNKRIVMVLLSALQCSLFTLVIVIFAIKGNQIIAAVFILVMIYSMSRNASRIRKLRHKYKYKYKG